MLLYTTPVAFLICYFLAIQPTVQLGRQNAQMRKQIEQADNAPARIAAQQARLGALNERLGISNSNKDKETSGTYTDAMLLQTVTDYCSQKRLKLSFPAQKIHEQGGYNLATNVISLEGDFHKALRLAYELEVNQNAGRISSLKFERRKDRKTKRQVLHTDIFLQNLKETIHED